MNLIQISAQLVGALGIAANVIIYQQKNGKNLLLFKLISDIIWFVHYFMITAYTGATIALIGVFREIVFMNKEKKWARSYWWLIFFILCSILFSVLTWKNIFSILPAMGSVISIVGFWKKNPRLSRVLALPISICMFAYDLVYSSYTGMANEIFTFISAIFAIARFKKKDSCKGEN